ncbi:SGNH/GDSL hydrolase family protein [Nocardioides bruguierae]|uniref:SGNH/GDSL hydrolase family protein n=1 Tax=Nocardioides bruguierae TaxID=2945102 RepID=UPI00202159E5|nr:SGNH/GDSL hydrolase family protein [Nocardioides bruguierae]MCL8024024.1 SGNH/GDSL hydrolase family protein [Nocardioides bruguierae]
MTSSRVRTPARRLGGVSAALVLPALVLATLGLAACSEDDGGATASSAEATRAADPQGPVYVALGDSYTAAPFVPTTDPNDGCLRSDGNYPSLVAQALDADLTDVSCSGATTTSLVGVQTTMDGTNQPAQFDALGEDTELVTLSIGGNDEDLFSKLLGGCVQLAMTDRSGQPCTDATSPREVRSTLSTIRSHVRAALEGIAGRAPNATVLSVGYPQIVPAEGSCQDLLPIADGDLDLAREINEGLADAVRDAADRAGVTYVDVWSLSEGHDICADDPWIAGAQTDTSQALAFHPYAAEQEAVAEAIVSTLDAG